MLALTLALAAGTWSVDGGLSAGFSTSTRLGATGVETGVGPTLVGRLRYDDAWAEVFAEGAFGVGTYLGPGAALGVVGGYRLTLFEGVKVGAAVGAASLALPAIDFDSFGYSLRHAPIVVILAQIELLPWLMLEVRGDAAGFFFAEEIYARGTIGAGLSLTWPFAVVESRVEAEP